MDKRDEFFIKKNAKKIAESLEKSNNVYLLRIIAHNLGVEVEELKDNQEKEN